MNRRTTVAVTLALILPAAALGVLAAAAAPSAPPPAPAKASAKEVARGEYLVKGTGCGDCHTPMRMGAQGPEPDVARTLSGHPEAAGSPPAPRLPDGAWAGAFTASNTGWAGPWGTSWAANLTPDKETGLGDWTAAVFVEAIRSGRHLAKGRPILPPMPWQAMKNLSDADLKAMFAYLQTLPAVRNRVPDPVVAGAAMP